MGWFSDAIARNLRQPRSGVVGWAVSKLLKTKNVNIINYTVKLCSIESNHHVLEVGFGPGLGLASVANIIRSGKGKIYGVDISETMVTEASKRLAEEVKQGKADVRLGDVASLPFGDSSMDRIFHTNCYYFWPDMNAASKELYRVLKPGGVMVTTIVLASLRVADSRGFMKYGKWEPETYIEALKAVGFLNVEMKSEYGENSQNKFEVIYAHKINV